MNKYILLDANTKGYLETQVNEWITNGYIPIGSVSTVVFHGGTLQYTQAMILQNNTNDETEYKKTDNIINFKWTRDGIGLHCFVNNREIGFIYEATHESTAKTEWSQTETGYRRFPNTELAKNAIEDNFTTWYEGITV